MYFPYSEIVTPSGGVETRTMMDSHVAAVPHFFASYRIADRV